MILLSNLHVAYYTMNFQAEDTNLNLKGHIEDLNFHFLSPDGRQNFHFMAKYIGVCGNVTVSIFENLALLTWALIRMA